MPKMQNRLKSDLKKKLWCTSDSNYYIYGAWLGSDGLVRVEPVVQEAVLTVFWAQVPGKKLLVADPCADRGDVDRDVDMIFTPH